MAASSGGIRNLKLPGKSPYSTAPNRMVHVGKNLGFSPGAHFEGVGYSSRSPDEALRKCCYWGTKPVVDKAVVRGPDGFYACVHYK